MASEHLATESARVTDERVDAVIEQSYRLMAILEVCHAVADTGEKETWALALMLKMADELAIQCHDELEKRVQS